MPLVVMCGFPASGKTTRGTQLSDYITKHFPSKKVHIVSDHPDGTKRNEIYSDSHREREFRGNLKSSVQRVLNKNDVIIADSMNYIKGFRYELYCVTKLCRTPHCVVYCVTDSDTSQKWNKAREENQRYDAQLVDELIMRFECPNSSSRWDKPLFSVLQDEELNFKGICDALFEQKAPPPNQSTQCQPLSATNFLFDLDQKTQDVVNMYMTAQKSAVPGEKIVLPDSKELTMTRVVSLAELQRHRRQFITYTKSHPIDDVSKLSGLFVEYLDKFLNN